MAIDWDAMDEVEATETIMNAAIEARATEIQLSCDDSGGGVFFLAKDSLDYFDQLPLACRERVSDYLRVLAGIDEWKMPVEHGNGLYTYKGQSHLFEVEIRRGAVATDTRIRILYSDDV